MSLQIHQYYLQNAKLSIFANTRVWYIIYVLNMQIIDILLGVWIYVCSWKLYAMQSRLHSMCEFTNNNETLIIQFVSDFNELTWRNNRHETWYKNDTNNVTKVTPFRSNPEGISFHSRNSFGNDELLVRCCRLNNHRLGSAKHLLIWH